MRVQTSFTVHKNSVGQEGGGVEGGRGDKGETEVLKQDAKRELRHSVLLRSDSAIKSLDERVGIEEEDLRRHFTKDQNLEGAQWDCE